MREIFLNILETGAESEMVEFLKKLSKEQKKLLVSEIKKKNKEYDSWEIRREPGVWDKIRMLHIAGFVCFGNTDIKRFGRNLPDVEKMDELLEWHCPEWFSDVVNNSEVLRGRDYKHIVNWQIREFLHPTKEIIVKTLPVAIILNGTKPYFRKYTTEYIEEYPITLNEHIWYLFEYPSNIDWTDKWLCDNINKQESKGNWCDTFIKYTSEGRLERMRVLRESLLTANRNMNKTLTGWFVTLFKSLEPTDNELLMLQDELLLALGSVQSKPINNSLNYIKKLCTNPHFNIDALIPYFPVLLNSEVKSIVQTTLTIIEIILKNRKADNIELCKITCNGFASKDESIQNKTADIIVKYGEISNEIVKELNVFSDNMLMSIKSLFVDYIEDNTKNLINTSDSLDSIPPLINEENKITEINSFEDFVFFLSQALDNTEAYHYGVLLSSLIQWGNQVDEHTLVLLEPTFKKAFKQAEKWSYSFEGLPLNVIISYYRYLKELYPSKLTKFDKAYDEIMAKEEQKVKDRENSTKEYMHKYEKRINELSHLHTSYAATGFRILAVQTFKTVQDNDTLPLLSTPTHLPTWIDPVILVQRLIQYIQAGRLPEDMDMQFALQRCALDQTEEALKLAKTELKGELMELMMFFLNGSVNPSGSFDHPSWWMTAAIIRSPGKIFPEFSQFDYSYIPVSYLTGNHQWEICWYEHMAIGKYNRETREYEKYPEQRLKISISTDEYEESKSQNPLLLEYLLNPRKVHIKYYIGATPNFPDNMYMNMAKYLIYCRQFWEAAEQEAVYTLIQIIHQLQTPFRDMHYLMFGVIMLGSLKSGRDYAGQIWVERVWNGTIDNKRIGETIAKLEFYELFPFKRLTDLIITSMIGISQTHNMALQEFIEAILKTSNPEPIKNFKKLLEIYNELLALNKSKVDIKEIPLLDTWKSLGSLKTIIKQILEK